MAKSKANKARQNNLQKARNLLKVTVEEVPDEGDIVHQSSDSESDSLHSDNSWDLDLGNELPDVDCDDIPVGLPDPDLDQEIVVAPEITEEKELDAFSQFLFDAQAAAQKAEWARDPHQKRPKRYHGNAPRTKRCHMKKGKDLAKKGFFSLSDFIQAKKNAAAVPLQNPDLDSTAQNTDHDSSVGDGFSAAQSPAESQSDSDSGSESGSEGEDEASPATAQSMEPSTEIHNIYPIFELQF
ncbi:hypothetical protein B0H13DRAFT_1852572 [Mycena leptocephala]|nr:hypothetical protein B0H13DRAFT_1852572 [Mycena leptocephala]